MVWSCVGAPFYQIKSRPCLVISKCRFGVLQYPIGVLHEHEFWHNITAFWVEIGKIVPDLCFYGILRVQRANRTNQSKNRAGLAGNYVKSPVMMLRVDQAGTLRMPPPFHPSAIPRSCKTLATCPIGERAAFLPHMGSDPCRRIRKRELSRRCYLSGRLMIWSLP